ncbi:MULTISPECIES: DUF3060 domain-containing protein [unclassified Arthrobacter]|uniref:DUF3060 domain-containing protein n=1 Tax=unclassified Arthrobacter TaxID=235627 RepID=UPI00149261C0|nr:MULTISPECIES: DUF3060 domain-containing protein [unclassified Arthrobacter]MBE0009143.1 DUF3060 domain-containing protein [Arthrobacter sp. AET 35A]NOJ63048.1 DUF3060 domain-containing protein [Arthrobacter sp. 147(2020)]
MTHRFSPRLTVGLAAVALLLTGCSTGDNANEIVPTTDSAAESTTESAATTPASPSAASTSEVSPSTEASPTAAAGAEGTPVTLSAGMDHRITESGSSHTVQCDGGGDVDVRADDVTLTVRGECEEIEIDGSGNTVTAENTREIDVQGNNNSVTATDVRDLSLEGTANTATLTSVEEIDVEGPDNTVTYETGTPEIDDEGSNSTITGP